MYGWKKYINVMQLQCCYLLKVHIDNSKRKSKPKYFKVKQLMRLLATLLISMVSLYLVQVLFKLVVITVLVIAESADNCIKTVSFHLMILCPSIHVTLFT